MITLMIYYAHWPLKVNRCILGVTERLGFMKRDMAKKLWLFAAACFFFLLSPEYMAKQLTYVLFYKVEKVELKYNKQG
jgi:hypothetical protein